MDAINFYKTLEYKEKYKLINGLFIVKYLDKDLCVVIADFHKAGSVFNETKINKVTLLETRQEFKPKLNLRKTALSFWLQNTINWNEKPISDIIK